MIEQGLGPRFRAFGGLLELSGRKCKIAVLNIVRGRKEKVDKRREQMGGISR